MEKLSKQKLNVSYIKKSYNQSIHKFNLLNEITSIINLDNAVNFPNLYNQIFLLSMQSHDDLIALLHEVLKIVKVKVISILKIETAKQSCLDHIHSFAEAYSIAENMIEKVKLIFINNETKFNKHLLSIINLLNSKLLISEQLAESNSMVYSQMKQYVSECDYIYSNTIVPFILNFLVNAGERIIFNEIIDITKNKILKRFTNMTSTEVINENNIAQYIEKYNNLIQTEVHNYQLLFPHQHANQLNERLIQITFIGKLPEMFSNEKTIEKLINLKDLSNLNLIYRIINRKSDILTSFQTNFFNFYTDKFLMEASLRIPTSTADGIQYIVFLIERVNSLNKIFEIAFMNDRRVHLAYKESISRIINYKNIKNLPTLCAFYLNEVMSKGVNDSKECQNKINNIMQILQNSEEMEIFFITTQKLMIKRISLLKFNLFNETFLIDTLRNSMGIRLCFPIYRVISDYKESDQLKQYLIEDPIGNTTLLSFNSINKNDLLQVLKISDYLIFGHGMLAIRSKYSNKYPHREVIFSQTLSTCIIKFVKKYDILVNFIQAHILGMLNTNKCIKVGSLIDLVTETKYVPYLRRQISSLAECGLIKLMGNKDEMLNTDSVELGTTWVLKENKVNNLSNFSEMKKDNELTKNASIQMNEQALEDSLESHKTIYKSNKGYIIDAKIMKILKNLRKVDDSLLIRTIMIDDFLKIYFTPMPDVSFIKQRIALLSERNLLTVMSEDNKIYYLY